MKHFLAFIVLLSYSLTQASIEPTTHIGCLDAGADEYSVLLNIKDDRVISYATLESDLQSEIPVVSSDAGISILYSTEYDTNLWYDVVLTNKMTESITLVPWISGNDSDNYHGSPSDQIVQCHLLKEKPTSAILKTENYSRSIPVQKAR